MLSDYVTQGTGNLNVDKKLMIEAVCLSSQEKRDLDRLADFYAVIKTVDHLEKNFVTGNIPSNVYEEHCQDLITKFSVMRNALKGKYHDFKAFMLEYRMEAPLALERLSIGIPATKLYQSTSGGKDVARREQVYILEAGQNFTTIVDSLKMGECAVDEILPLFRDLCGSLRQISALEQNFEREMLERWLTRLNGMSADHVLSQTDSRTMAMDLDCAYSAFHKAIREVNAGTT